jgi:hypothetical protein
MLFDEFHAGSLESDLSILHSSSALIDRTLGRMPQLDHSPRHRWGRANVRLAPLNHQTLSIQPRDKGNMPTVETNLSALSFLKPSFEFGEAIGLRTLVQRDRSRSIGQSGETLSMVRFQPRYKLGSPLIWSLETREPKNSSRLPYSYLQRHESHKVYTCRSWFRTSMITCMPTIRFTDRALQPGPAI